ncbi:MAG: hypothetical protein IPN18_18665 [Ignavibacteriales bacterium]|nr:hypothetical protein [Ignavibacteriales bacterium]
MSNSVFNRRLYGDHKLKRVIGNYSQKKIYVVITLLFSLLFVSCKDETGVGHQRQTIQIRQKGS